MLGGYTFGVVRTVEANPVTYTLFVLSIRTSVDCPKLAAMRVAKGSCVPLFDISAR